MGTQIKLSTSYHPQTDGQTERVNQCIEMYLRCLYGQKPKKWAKVGFPWLSGGTTPLISFTIEMSPFKTLYSRMEVQRRLKDNLSKAQERMVCYAKKRRSERHFVEGDEVFLKLQPYRQSTVQAKSNQKLSTKFYGPYKVL
ncbi:hypothetical protein AgCh_029332 [Apium graveolens]